MGISIMYTPLSPVSKEVRAAIIEDAKAVNSQHSWWAEGLWLDDSEDSFFGATKIFLSGYTASDGSFVPTDPDDDLFMACRDIHFIINTLARWAKQYEIEWDIDMEGPAGVVTPDGPDDQLREMLSVLGDECGYEHGSEASAERAANLHAQWSSP